VNTHPLPGRLRAWIRPPFALAHAAAREAADFLAVLRRGRERTAVDPTACEPPWRSAHRHLRCSARTSRRTRCDQRGDVVAVSLGQAAAYPTLLRQIATLRCRKLMSPQMTIGPGDTDVELRRRREGRDEDITGLRERRERLMEKSHWNLTEWLIPCSRGCPGLNRRPPGRELESHHGCPSLLTARRRIARVVVRREEKGWRCIALGDQESEDGPPVVRNSHQAQPRMLGTRPSTPGRHRRSPQREPRTHEIRRAVLGRVYRDLKDLKDPDSN
jgi:hypothetical protein